jgi:hypothetical protein
MEEEILNRMQALPERRNPFDEGIAKAISSSRSNLGMTRDQEHRAINNAFLALGNGLAGEPVQRGFKNNLGVIGRAMNPALAAYNTSEDAAFKENEQLASQILQQQRAQEALEAAKEEKAWHRKFQERQLEETKRYHNLLDNFKREKGAGKSLLDNFKKSEKDREKQESLEELKGMLTHAENKVKNLGSEGERGIFKRMINKSWLPTGGDLPLTKEQAEIQTIGDVLKGKLFNAWGYRNQAEFNHVPSVSPDNDMTTNLRIIGDLKQMLLNVGDPSPQEEWVKIQAPSGAIEEIHFEDVPKALSRPGYSRVQ